METTNLSEDQMLLMSKARRKDNGEWEYGYIIKNIYSGTAYIILYNNELYIEEWASDYMHITGYIEVDKRTICRCTGIKDKNGNWIYENDLDAYGKVVRYEIFQLHPLGYGILGWLIGNTALITEIGFKSNIEIVDNIYNQLEIVKDKEP